MYKTNNKKPPSCFLSISCTSEELPFWQSMDHLAPVVLYDVNPFAKEGVEISTKFHQTLFYPEFRIQRVWRIQNPILWLHYSLKKKQLSQELGGAGRYPEERQLFHGTFRDRLEPIIKQGFDWRIGKTHGKKLGNGIYFGRHAVGAHEFTDCGGDNKSTRWKTHIFYSKPLQFQSTNHLQASENGTAISDIWSLFKYHSHTDSHFMLAVRVLVGRYTMGKPSLLRPPQFDERDLSVRYDSCVDNVSAPQTFVIFDQYQAYPEYVIEYQHCINNRLRV
ncbi:protein mono-ADP-ribosyltransferase TIPARP-like isoform X1 [Biomphalaria glabrata]|uniref:Poly [ADP-ribose] polymerase n=1 Tax=Biomphalaria glabrata TaxID=6526 RepID=A0A9W3AVU3_BIOGL|nr:protein mono-ADP-ribosyltransferase TIPARP-like isoform X1 [Biomphalaria glabrata]XP_055891343.1 protein mono-ADP-ribosyltransferase TIPARP-like isoform X1 [Biomphalaria glabrata]KAI8790177.1 TCDD-inducible poly [ADP-ribose] polymerase [Biomphalaria glabrata]